MIRSLRLRLLFGALIAITLSLLMVWFALSRVFTLYVTQQYQNEMTVLADSLAAQITFVGGQLTLAREPGDPRFDLPAGGRYWQVSAPGAQILRSRSLWDTELTATSDDAPHFGEFYQTDGPGGTPILIMRRQSSLDIAAQQVSFTVHAGFEQQELDGALTSFHDELRRMLVATAALLLVAALLQGALGLSPLRRLRANVANIRSGENRSLGDDGPSEVRPLVNEINMLIDERETALERARNRASDLAHGLKTPLTVLSHLVESLPADQRETALKQVHLIRQRADRQLQAARLGVEQMATTGIASLISKLVQVLRPVTRDRDITWQVAIPDDLTVGLDPADFAEATGNLLDNAAKWTRSIIRVSAEKIDDRILIRVEDDGPGIAEHDRMMALKRGHHSDDQAAGHGLGLAITQDIAKAYGGRLEIGTSMLGGALLTLGFPAQAGSLQRAAPHC